MKTFKTITQAHEYILSVEGLAYATRVRLMADLKRHGDTILNEERLVIVADNKATQRMRSIELADFTCTNEGVYELDITVNIYAVLVVNESGTYYLDLLDSARTYLNASKITIDTALCIINSVVSHLGETHPTEELDQLLVEKLNSEVLQSNTAISARENAQEMENLGYFE